MLLQSSETLVLRTLNTTARMRLSHDLPLSRKCPCVVFVSAKAYRSYQSALNSSNTVTPSRWLLRVHDAYIRSVEEKRVISGVKFTLPCSFKCHRNVYAVILSYRGIDSWSFNRVKIRLDCHLSRRLSYQHIIDCWLKCCTSFAVSWHL